MGHRVAILVEKRGFESKNPNHPSFWAALPNRSDIGASYLEDGGQVNLNDSSMRIAQNNSKQWAMNEWMVGTIKPNTMASNNCNSALGNLTIVYLRGTHSGRDGVRRIGWMEQDIRKTSGPALFYVKGKRSRTRAQRCELWFINFNTLGVESLTFL